MLSDLMSAAGVSVVQKPSTDPSGICIRSISADSRRVEPGACFVAVPGSRVSGASFIDEAVRRGAVAVVGERTEGVPPGVGAVHVTNARSALARLAAAFYGFAPGQVFSGMRLVGVTGTNGKTTTCTMIRSILREAGDSAAMLGTIAYDLVGEVRPAPWTTPPPVELYESLSTAAMHGATHAVMEVSSHALAQSRCDGHRFAVAVFTNLSGDHLDYHKDVEDYANAKKRLFDALDGDATAVVNADDDFADHMLRNSSARVMRFAVDAKADVTADVHKTSITDTRFTLRSPQGDTVVTLPLTGRHNVANALAAASACLSLEADLEVIRRGLESLEGVCGRLQRIDGGRLGVQVFVDYAHTDDALRNVLTTLRTLTAGRLICVFGCGGDRDRSKRPRMAQAVAAIADHAFVTSDNPRSEAPMAIIEDILPGFEGQSRCTVSVEPDRGPAIATAIEMAQQGDAVLIAGKGHEDYQIVGDLRRHFDDAECAGAVIAKLEGIAS